MPPLRLWFLSLTLTQYCTSSKFAIDNPVEYMQFLGNVYCMTDLYIVAILQQSSKIKPILLSAVVLARHMHPS